MNNTQKRRNSSIELLRILSMASVIGCHFFYWGGVLESAKFGTIEYAIYWAIDGLFFTCINCFMLITGYFLSASKMRVSRLVKFWLQVLFYSVFCTFAAFAITGDISIKTLATAFVPLTTEQYWYATHYALVICLVPMLNALIQSLDKNSFKSGLIILTIIFSFMPTFFVWERDLLTSGRDYPWMIVLYLTGGYIRKYGISIGRKESFIGFWICVLITGLLRTPLGMISMFIIGNDVLAGLFFRYNSITVFCGAVFLFNAMLQGKNDERKKAVLAIAPLSFAVYLVHDNPNIRSILWGSIPMTDIMAGGMVKTIIALCVIIISVFLVGCLIEKSRLLVAKVMHLDRLYVWIDELFLSKVTNVINKNRF